MLDVFQTGVYCITNTFTGKRYIGSAGTSFRSRWNVHLSDLRRGKHHSRHLQRAWNKHGERAFVFEVILVCSPNDCLTYEQRFIEHFNSANPRCGYNIAPNAGNCLGVKHTVEAKAKMAAAKRGKKLAPETIAKLRALSTGRQHTPEAKEKVAAANRGRKDGPERIAKMAAGLRGKEQTSATIAKRSASLSGRKRNPETVAKIAAANRFKRRSPEAKAKMSVAKAGKKQSPDAIARRAVANRGKIRTPAQRDNLRVGMMLAKLRRAEEAAALGLPPPRRKQTPEGSAKRAAAYHQKASQK